MRYAVSKVLGGWWPVLSRPEGPVLSGAEGPLSALQLQNMKFFGIADPFFHEHK